MRLGPLSGDVPKCLLQLGGSTLLDFQIRTLRAQGCEEICVVAGHESEQVKRSVAGLPGVTVLINEAYATTNSLYSLLLARDWVRSDFLCINGDLLAHPDILRRLLIAGGCALAFDSSSGGEDEHMKVQTDGRRLRHIGKHLDGDAVEGENVGMLLFSAEAVPALFQEAQRLVEDGGEMAWAPMVLNRIAERTAVQCVDVRGLQWIEVDFPEDLERARHLVWPAVRGDARRTGAACAPQPAPLRVAGENLR